MSGLHWLVPWAMQRLSRSQTTTYFAPNTTSNCNSTNQRPPFCPGQTNQKEGHLYQCHPNFLPNHPRSLSKRFLVLKDSTIESHIADDHFKGNLKFLEVILSDDSPSLRFVKYEKEKYYDYDYIMQSTSKY